MTRGRCGSLPLHRVTLSFTTPRRFNPAHGGQPMGSTEIARSAPSATTGVRAGTSGARRVGLPVAGLTCHNCVQAVERALQAVPGVTAATVNLVEGRAVGGPLPPRPPLP